MFLFLWWVLSALSRVLRYLPIYLGIFSSSQPHLAINFQINTGSEGKPFRVAIYDVRIAQLYSVSQPQPLRDSRIPWRERSLWAWIYGWLHPTVSVWVASGFFRGNLCIFLSAVHRTHSLLWMLPLEQVIAAVPGTGELWELFCETWKWMIDAWETWAVTDSLH